MTTTAVENTSLWQYATAAHPDPRTAPFMVLVSEDRARWAITETLVADGESPTGLRLWPGQSQFDAQTNQEG